MPPNLPRKHHYIPQFFQRRWAGSDAKVQYFQKFKGGLKSYRKHPSQIGYTKDLYTWCGQRREFICLEIDFFSRIDGDAAQAFDNIMAINRIPNDAKMRSSVIRFMLSLMHRTPYQVAAFRSGYDALWRQPDHVIQAKYDAIRTSCQPYDLSEFILTEDPDAIDRAFMKQIVASITHKRVGQFMINLNWDLRRTTSAKNHLMIGDAAGIWSNGLDKPDGHCGLAIGPDALLLISRNTEIKSRLLGLSDNQIVRAYNRQVVQGSRIFIVAKDDSQKSFIERHFAKSPMASWPEKLATELGVTTE